MLTSSTSRRISLRFDADDNLVASGDRLAQGFQHASRLAPSASVSSLALKGVAALQQRNRRGHGIHRLFETEERRRHAFTDGGSAPPLRPARSRQGSGARSCSSRRLVMSEMIYKRPGCATCTEIAVRVQLRCNQ